jgi:hypothetical protein
MKNSIALPEWEIDDATSILMIFSPVKVDERDVMTV